MVKIESEISIFIFFTCAYLMPPFISTAPYLCGRQGPLLSIFVEVIVCVASLKVMFHCRYSAL